MAVLRRENFVSQQRVDVPDMRAIESAVSNDFDQLLQGLILSNLEGYVLRGFDIVMTGAIGGAANGLLMNVSTAAVLHPFSSQSGTFFVVPAGTPVQILNSALNTQVSGAFTPSSQNFVGIEYSRMIDDATAAQVYIWDPTINDETTSVIPRANILQFKIVISTGTWAPNVLPIAIVTTDAGNNVSSIEDTRRMLFRLGTGGRTTPNPLYSYPWNAQSEGRVESPFISTSNGVNPFHGGDKMLFTYKDWQDAIMTKIKEITGSAFWYSPGSSAVADVNLTDLFFDSASSVLTMRGKFIHSKVTPGNLVWSGDIHIDSIIGPLFYTIPSGTVTLSDGQVAYVTLIRNQNFQSSNTFTFTNGSATVTATTLIAGISAGDWIKFFSDDTSKWAKVLTVIGSTITLTSTYQGSSASGNALRSQGSYTMQVANPINVPASSNTFWIAKRDDNGSITATIAASPTGASRTSGVTTFTTTLAHGINAGQNVQVSGVTDSTFNGFFEVISTPLTTTFTVTNTGSNGTSGSGTVSSTATIYLRGIGELTQGSASSDTSSTIEAMLQYIGSAYAGDFQPQYSSTNYVIQGVDLTTAIGELDAQAGSSFTSAKQDRNLKLINGGNWSWSLAGSGSSFVSNNDSFSYSRDTALTSLQFAQAFQVPAGPNQVLGSVQVDVFQNGGAVVPNSNVFIDIYAASSSDPWLPTGSVLFTSDAVAANSLPTASGSLSTFTFSSPPTLTASSYYAFVVRLGTNLSTNLLSVSAHAPLTGLKDSDTTDSGGTWNPLGNENFSHYSLNAPASPNALRFSSNAFIQIPGLTDARNTIPTSASPITLASDDDVAYVEINRTAGGTTNLAVTVAQSSSVVMTNNTVVIARRVGTSVIVGTHSFRLVDGESKELDAGLSIENRMYIGIANEADSDPDYTTSPFGSLALPNYNSSNGEGLTIRLAKITSMLADINQDLNIEFDPGTITWNGTNITVTSASLSIPGTTVGAAPVSINNLGATALVANSCLYVDISRTSGSALTLASSTIAALTPSQQRLILARNIAGSILVR